MIPFRYSFAPSLALLLCSVWFFSISYTSQAQTTTGTVSGRITSRQGLSLPGANVVLRGTSLGTATAEDGGFELLNVPEGKYVLDISSLGFQSQQQTITVRPSETTTVRASLSDNTAQLNDVVVSASRRAESINETPASVTILGAKEIAVQAAVTPNNLAAVVGNAVPGLGLTTNQTSNVGQTLRGRNLLVLIDGIPQSTPLRAGGRELRTIDPSVLERIEVIKGATSIYGNGADGGLINYITKRPVAGKTFGGQTIVGLNTNVVEARNSVGYRATQQFYGKLKAFDYVVSGTFDQSGVYKDARGQVISPEYGLGETKSYNGFAKLGYDLNEKNRLELMYNYFGSRQNSDYVVQAGRYGESPAIGVRGERLGVDEGTRFNHNSYLTYRGQELLGGTSLEATLYYQNFRTIYSNAAGFFETDGQSQIDSDKKGLRFNLNTPFLKGEAFNADVTYGLDVLNDVTSQTLTDGRVWAPEMDMHNLAPYAQLRSTLFTYFVLKAGARVENIQIKVPDYTTIRTRSGSSIVGGVDVQGGTLKYDAAVYNAGLRYTRFKFFNPFLSYSEGFSLYELGRTLRASTAVNLDLLQTDPIIVRNREVGFNSQLGPVNLGGVYYVSKSDLGGNLVEQNGVLVLQRVPERVSGYELTLDVAALPNLSVGGSYSYVEGKATTQLDLDRDGVAETKRKVYLNGTRVQPPKATAYVRYSPIEALSLNLNWIYSGRRDRFDPLATPTATSTYRLGEGRIEAFDLFNLSAAYRVKPQVTVNLGVENLLNTAYYSPYAQLQGSSANYTRGNGARVNLSAGYSF